MVEQINIIIGRIYRSGMTTTSGGNISLRDDNEISGSHRRAWIKKSDHKDIMCVIKDGAVRKAFTKPSSNILSTGRFIRISSGYNGIIHAHPPALVAFSIAGTVPDTKLFRRRIMSVAISVLRLMAHLGVKTWKKNCRVFQDKRFRP